MLDKISKVFTDVYTRTAKGRLRSLKNIYRLHAEKKWSALLPDLMMICFFERQEKNDQTLELV